MCQGFAIGREWGGATTLVTEYAPPHRRGFFGTFVQLGNVLGLFIATAVFAIVAWLPESQLMSWGWRIPFLLSVALLFVGLYIRAKIEETPVFTEGKNTESAHDFPIIAVLKCHWRAVLTAMGMRVGEMCSLADGGVFYVLCHPAAKLQPRDRPERLIAGQFRRYFYLSVLRLSVG